MKRISAALFLILAASASAVADPKCASLSQDVSVRSTLASAGFFTNLRNADHSLRHRTDVLLRESENAAAQLFAREMGCQRACAHAVVAVVFSTTPNMALTNYDERERCQELLTKTRQRPIQFLNRSFDELEDLESWYSDLMQGDGKDGESLYEQCPGRCSPHYTSTLFKRGGSFDISTSVVCGHARDKDDDQYVLRAALRWVCPS